MKKWFIPAGIVLVLAAIAFIPVKQSYQLSINSNYYNVYQNLASAQNWVKWNPDFLGKNAKIDSSGVNSFCVKSPLSTAKLQIVGLGAFNINVSGGSGAGLYDCVVTTTDTANVTRAFVRHRSRLAGYLWAAIKNDTNSTFIYKLKSYLENTRARYGFLIGKQNTHDQFFIVKANKLPADSVCSGNIKMLKYLKALSAKFKLDTSDTLRLQYLSTVNDTAEVILGVSISKEKVTDKTVQFMQMPGSKVLVGNFKGKYKDRQKLYQALYLYMSDHNIHQQTKPYETFTNNTLPLNDESIVDMQVIVPYV
ncbi:MAG: hypothetical protein JKY70_07480 [Mucilaginibacter sp.]|nr:hypothetical protein [Mucilaginibacter sp.]